MLLQLLFLVSIVCGKFVKEEGIVVLNDDNFKEALKKYPLILVEFYSPWCGLCKKFASEYVSAAEAVSLFKEPATLAKVDATTNPKLTKEYGIKRFPTLKFFRNGHVCDYYGDRTKDDVINFIKERSEPLTSSFNTAQEFKDYLKKNSFVVVGYFDDEESEEYKQLEEVVSTMDSIQAVGITFSDIADDMNAEIPSIYVYCGVDHYRQFTGHKKDLRKWILINTLPLIIPFTAEYSKILFSDEISIHTQLIVFAPEQSISKYSKPLESVAEYYHEKIFVVHIPSENGRLMSHFGISTKAVPAVILANFEKEQMVKYRFSGELTEDNLKVFLVDYYENRLHPFYISEESPTQVGSVKKIVGTTFEEVVYDPTKSVLVLFCASYSYECKDIYSIYQTLGKTYENDKEVVIAQMDTAVNEVEGLVIHKFPMIQFYTAGEDGRHMIEYKGDESVDALKDFIEQNRVYKIEEDKEDVEDEKVETVEKDEEDL